MVAIPPLRPSSVALAAANDPVDPTNYVFFDKTGHNVSGLFLSFYNTYGGLDKFGYPRTEVVIEGGRKVQYFQRAVYEHWPENPAGQQVQLRLLGDIMTTSRRPFPTVEPFPNSDGHQYFSETKHGVHSVWLDYFNKNGGITYFGYPISEILIESGLLVQYFQRARVEYHPENAGTQYMIQLGLLGDQYISQVAKLPANILAATTPKPSTTLASLDSPGTVVTNPNPPPTQPSNGVMLTTGMRYGFQSHYPGQNMDQINGWVTGAGFSWIKQQLVWKDIEQDRGQYNWGVYDAIVDAAQRDGVKVLFSIVGNPAWARNDRKTNGPPDNLQDFAPFLTAMAAHWKGRVAAYEIWNEQNLYYEWGDGPVDAGKYIELLKVAYPAVKQGDPNAIVVSGALTPTGVINPAIAIDDRLYFEQMYQYQNGVFKNIADAIGFHAFGANNPPDDDPTTTTKPSNSYKGHWSFYFRNIEKFRDIMVKYGDDKRQIFITEYHWASTTVPVPGYLYGLDVSEEEQAKFLVRGFQMMTSNYYPWVGAAFVWNLNYRVMGLPLTDEKTVFSVLNSNATPRPAYLALRDMAKPYAV